MKYAVEMKSNLEATAANLQAAKESLEKAQYDVAASRAAEAVFHTATVLLLDEEIQPDRHGDVISLIHQIFVNGRRLTKEQGENLSWLLELRNAERQGVARPVSSDEARKAVEFADGFFAAARVILEV
jgi:uncharacterized protein (UPF0332 family)